MRSCYKPGKILSNAWWERTKVHSEIEAFREKHEVPRRERRLLSLFYVRCYSSAVITFGGFPEHWIIFYLRFRRRPNNRLLDSTVQKQRRCAVLNVNLTKINNQGTLGTRGFSRVRPEFSALAEGRHIFGGPWPKPWAAKGHYKDLTETGNRTRKVSGTQGTIRATMNNSSAPYGNIGWFSVVEKVLTPQADQDQYESQ